MKYVSQEHAREKKGQKKETMICFAPTSLSMCACESFELVGVFHSPRHLGEIWHALFVLTHDKHAACISAFVGLY
jgi:hypothetical protein